MDINEEEPITAQGSLETINSRQNPREKSKIKITLCRRKIYHITDLEEIRSRFDKIRPVISHLKLCTPKRTTTPKNIREGFKDLQRRLWRERLFKPPKKTSVCV